EGQPRQRQRLLEVSSERAAEGDQRERADPGETRLRFLGALAFQAEQDTKAQRGAESHRNHEFVHDSSIGDSSRSRLPLLSALIQRNGKYEGMRVSNPL